MESDLFNWPGASGRIHEFWVYRLNQKFDAMGAIFLYVRALSADDISLVYVNQTNRMDLVRKNPIADEIISEYKPTQIHVLFNENVSERKGIMADLILKHNPHGNKQA